MTYSIISKALVIGTLVVSAFTSVAVAGEELHAREAVEAQDENAVITVEQQQELELTVLSWQKNLAQTLQNNRDNMMLLNNNIDYQQDPGEFVVDSGDFRKHIVRN